MDNQFDDITLLLDSLKYQADDARQQEQALKALSTFLAQAGSAKEYFNHCGGPKFVLDLVKGTKHKNVTLAGLYTLAVAVEGHGKSQKQLSTIEVFCLIKSYLQSKYSSLITSSAFFLICLVTNNGEAQILARQTKCITVMCELFKSCSTLGRSTSTNNKTEPLLDAHSAETWTTITTALCPLLVNPQNVENQLLCCGLFPVAVSIVKSRATQQLKRPAVIFLGVCVSGNVKAQTKLQWVGGLHVLIGLLKDMVSKTTLCEDDIEFASNLLSTLGAALDQNNVNARTASELGVVPTLLKYLQQGVSPVVPKEATNTFFTKCIITISSCIELSEESRQQFMECRGVPICVDLMTRVQDEEFKKIVTFVLHCCVVQEEDEAIRDNFETRKSTGDAVGDEVCVNKTSMSQDKLNSPFKESTIIEEMHKQVKRQTAIMEQLEEKMKFLEDKVSTSFKTDDIGSKTGPDDQMANKKKCDSEEYHLNDRDTSGSTGPSIKTAYKRKHSNGGFQTPIVKQHKNCSSNLCNTKKATERRLDFRLQRDESKPKKSSPILKNTVKSKASKEKPMSVEHKDKRHEECKSPEPTGSLSSLSRKGEPEASKHKGNNTRPPHQQSANYSVPNMKFGLWKLVSRQQQKESFGSTSVSPHYGQDGTPLLSEHEKKTEDVPWSRETHLVTKSPRRTYSVSRSGKASNNKKRCPGCYNTPNMNSKTFASILLGSSTVCSRHKEMARILERHYSELKRSRKSCVSRIKT